jgi:Berberine and berberine like
VLKSAAMNKRMIRPLRAADLVAVKEKFDPSNLFRVNQSIKPAA